MKYYFLIGFVFFLLLSGCVMEQDIVILDDRVAMMEQRLSDLERRNFETEKKLSEIKSLLDTYSQSREDKDQFLRDQGAELRVALSGLREEIQALNGRTEETRYLLKRKLKTLEKSEAKIEDRFHRIEESTGSIKDRIGQIEEYLNFESPKPDEAEKKPEGPTEKELSESEVYTMSKNALDKGDLEAAREGFNKFIKRYPKSDQADNAQFWIGEVYYREKWYEKAILEYQKVVEKYPKGNKVPSALLKQGFAFFNLKDKANSRLILKELVKKYPGSNEAKIAKQKLKEIK